MTVGGTGLSRSLLATMIVWAASCVAIYVVLTRVFALTSGFSAGLVVFTVLLTLPALVAGLGVGIRGLREQRERGSQDRGVNRLSRELLLVAIGFAFVSVLVLSGILALEKGAFLLASGLVVVAALVSWLSTRRLRRFTEGL